MHGGEVRCMHCAYALEVFVAALSLPSEYACMVEGFDACTAEWFDPWCTAGQCGSLNLRCGSIHSPFFTLTG